MKDNNFKHMAPHKVRNRLILGRVENSLAKPHQIRQMSRKLNDPIKERREEAKPTLVHPCQPQRTSG